MTLNIQIRLEQNQKQIIREGFDDDKNRPQYNQKVPTLIQTMRGLHIKQIRINANI